MHRLAQRYRACEAMRVEKQEFVRRSAAMENKPSWRAYRAAYAHTRCSAREYFIFRFYEKSRVECDSYLTLRRSDRFIHHIGGLPDFKALRFTRYNQYESMILPMVAMTKLQTAPFRATRYCSTGCLKAICAANGLTLPPVRRKNSPPLSESMAR